MSLQTKKRFYFFLKQKRAKMGLFVFILLMISSLFANILSNNKPILLITTIDMKYRIFYPAFIHYNPEELGLKDIFFIDYKEYLNQHKKAFAIQTINQWDSEEQSDSVLASPSKDHYLGTDNLGRDIFARLLYGTRTSLLFAFTLWIISYSVGILLGLLQGYFIGVFDFILERIKELAAIIPMLTVVILITSITKSQSFWSILILVLLFAWMGISSQIRASVLSLRKRDYCEASLALGSSHFKTILKHVLPNTLTPIITLSPFAIEAGISLLAALDYLGFGLPPPTPSLGELMSQGKDNLQNAPWVLASPIITILLLLISISLIGQALRDAFDPRNV